MRWSGFLFYGHQKPLSSLPEFSQKHLSSFRLYDKSLITLQLQTERCYKHPSAMLHFVLRRTINRSTENGKSFGWEWFIVRLRTFYRLPQWKEAERWTPYPSFRNTLYESHLPYILKDERSFWKNLGGERMKKEDTSIRLLPFKCILLIYQPAWLP